MIFVGGRSPRFYVPPKYDRVGDSSLSRDEYEIQFCARPHCSDVAAVVLGLESRHFQFTWTRGQVNIPTHSGVDKVSLPGPRCRSQFDIRVRTIYVRTLSRASLRPDP